MSIEAALTFLIAIFIFAITPGPGTFALLAKALASGASSCLSMAFGMAISDVIYLILATFGLATIAENYSGSYQTPITLSLWCRISGVYLAINLWVSYCFVRLFL